MGAGGGLGGWWADIERKWHGEGGKREVWGRGKRDVGDRERYRKRKRRNGDEKIQGPQTQTPTASQRTTTGPK